MKIFTLRYYDRDVKRARRIKVEALNEDDLYHKAFAAIAKKHEGVTGYRILKTEMENTLKKLLNDIESVQKNLESAWYDKEKLEILRSYRVLTQAKDMILKLTSK